LVEAHLHLADYHTRRYASRGVPEEDLRQVARIAIIAAVERFDPDLGPSFRTFASRTIDGECKRFIRDRTWCVRPPRAVQELHLRAGRAQEELTHQLGRPPTVPELADRLEATIDDVLEALDAGAGRSGLSLDGPAPGAPAGATRTLGDALGRADPSFAAVEDRILARMLVELLSDRDRRIVHLRFVRGATESAIAEDLGVSQSYLSRMLHRILDQLRAAVQERQPPGGDLMSRARITSRTDIAR
jgi:RNA polymerase sigma-B factor